MTACPIGKTARPALTQPTPTSAAAPQADQPDQSEQSHSLKPLHVVTVVVLFLACGAAAIAAAILIPIEPQQPVRSETQPPPPQLAGVADLMNPISGEAGYFPLDVEPLDLQPVSGAQLINRRQIIKAGNQSQQSFWLLPETLPVDEALEHYRKQLVTMGLREGTAASTDPAIAFMHFFKPGTTENIVFQVLKTKPKARLSLVYIKPAMQ